MRLRSCVEWPTIRQVIEVGAHWAPQIDLQLSCRKLDGQRWKCHSAIDRKICQSSAPRVLFRMKVARWRRVVNIYVFFYDCAPDDDLVCLALSTRLRCRSEFWRNKLVDASVWTWYQDRELDANKTKWTFEPKLMLLNIWFEKVLW